MDTGPAQERIDLDLTLAHHATMGFTTETLLAIRTGGREAWLDAQLHPIQISDLAADAFVRQFASIGMSVPELYSNYGGNTIVPVSELQRVCVGRSMLSERELYERVVEFWHDHFNVAQLEGNSGRLFFHAYDRDVIRPGALGSFEDLLVATAKSASMLYYLNGNKNVAGAPNENFAREVMELHTLGVDGPYTETDVRELARCFTGWRFVPLTGAQAGDFVFSAAHHDFDAKTVLGRVIPAGGGLDDALDVLHDLAVHPKTLDYVSRKLISWLAAYDPPQAAVDLVVGRWQVTGGDLREVVRAALSDEVLLLCEAHRRRKLKRPYHFAIGLMRQLGAETSDLFAAVPRMLELMGQRPYTWGPPDGYPDSVGAWGSDAFGRWRFASNLLDGDITGTMVTTAGLAGLAGGTPATGLARRLSYALSGGLMDAAEVARIQSFIDTRPLNESTLREAVALLASCPSYQFY